MLPWSKQTLSSFLGGDTHRPPSKHKPHTSGFYLSFTSHNISCGFVAPVSAAGGNLMMHLFVMFGGSGSSTRSSNTVTIIIRHHYHYYCIVEVVVVVVVVVLFSFFKNGKYM